MRRPARELAINGNLATCSITRFRKPLKTPIRMDRNHTAYRKRYPHAMFIVNAQPTA
jgi:hypothetical protein